MQYSPRSLYSSTGLLAPPRTYLHQSPLFAVETGDHILLPDSIHSLRLEGSGGGSLGEGDATVLWPVANLAEGGKTDLSEVLPPESAVGIKLFAGPLGPAENWCALERPSAGVPITMRFDSKATPILDFGFVAAAGQPGRGRSRSALRWNRRPRRWTL